MSTCVFFFGGYKATDTDMKVWLGSAQAQKSDARFTAFPWPSGGAADSNGAVAAFKKAGQYAAAIEAVQSSDAEQIYLAGHSSGCAIANAVDRGLKDHSKIVLVALDGFVPDRKQLSRSSTQVWAAECDGAKSRNYKALKNHVGSRLKVYTATNARKEWALHFSLVNSAANDTAVTSIRTGYAGCRANLAWL